MTEKEINDALVAKMEDEALAIQEEAFEVAETLFDAYPDLDDADQTDVLLEVAHRACKIQEKLDTLNSLLKVYLGPHLYSAVTNEALKKAFANRKKFLGN